MNYSLNSGSAIHTPDPLAFATRLYNKLPALKRSFKFELGIAFSGVLGMALKS